MEAAAVPPPPLDEQAIRDREHLKLLGIFHLVGAGFSLLGLGFLFVQFVFMHAVIMHHGLERMGRGPDHFPFQLMGVFYLFFGVWMVASLVLNLMSGCFLLARRHRVFSIVVGAFNCVHIPIGTLLGVFTIIVLARESVRREYR